MRNPWPLLLLIAPSILLAQETRTAASAGNDSSAPPRSSDEAGEQQMREALAGIEAGFKEEAQLAEAGRPPVEENLRQPGSTGWLRHASGSA